MRAFCRLGKGLGLPLRQLLAGIEGEVHHLALPQPEDGAVLQHRQPAALHTPGGLQILDDHGLLPVRPVLKVVGGHVHRPACGPGGDLGQLRVIFQVLLHRIPALAQAGLPHGEP